MKKTLYSVLFIMVLSASKVLPMATDNKRNESLYRKGAQVARTIDRAKALFAGGGFVSPQTTLGPQDRKAYEYYLQQRGGGTLEGYTPSVDAFRQEPEQVD